MNNYPYDRFAKASMGSNRGSSVIQGGTTTALPENPVPAMAYVPFQTDTTTFDEVKAFKVGTLFCVLDKPFLGRGIR